MGTQLESHLSEEWYNPTVWHGEDPRLIILLTLVAKVECGFWLLNQWESSIRICSCCGLCRTQGYRLLKFVNKQTKTIPWCKGRSKVIKLLLKCEKTCFWGKHQLGLKQGEQSYNSYLGKECFQGGKTDTLTRFPELDTCLWTELFLLDLSTSKWLAPEFSHTAPQPFSSWPPSFSSPTASPPNWAPCSGCSSETQVRSEPAVEPEEGAGAA